MGVVFAKTLSLTAAPSTSLSCTATTSAVPAISKPTSMDVVASITVVCNFDMTKLPGFSVSIGLIALVSSQASDAFHTGIDRGLLTISPTNASSPTNAVTLSNIIVNDQGLPTGVPGSPLVNVFVSTSYPGYPGCDRAGLCDIPVTPTQLVLATNGPAGTTSPTITTTALPQATQGSPYSFTLSASGGVPPYTWSGTGLPNGLGVSPAGVVSGTPTTGGTFTPTFTVRDNAGASDSKTLSLSVAAAGPNLGVSPISLNFITRTGQNPAAQILHIQAPNMANVRVDASYPPGTAAGWLTRTQSPSSFDFVVAANVTGLTPGNYGAILTVSCTGQTCNPPAVVVGVTLNISPLSITVTPNPAPLVSIAQGTTQTLPFEVTTSDGASQNVPISVNTSSGGTWLKSSLQGIQAPGRANITVDTTGMSTGAYSGTVTFSCALTTSSDGACTAVQVPITLNVSSGPNTPTVRSAISASGFGGFSTIAPGTFIEIYGSNLSTTDTGRTWAGNDFTNNGRTAPISLDRTTVSVGGKAAFVYYVSPGQVNALVPSDVGTGPSIVTVTSPTGTSAAYAITINSVQPGFLAPPSFQIGGKQYVAALLAGVQPNTFAIPTSAINGVASRPVRPGDIILIYGVGFGPVTPQINAGTVVSQSNALTIPLTVSFGNTPAQLTYSGLAPNFTGLYQFNVVVPQIPDNDAVPLKFNLGGVDGAQTLFIAVHR